MNQDLQLILNEDSEFQKEKEDLQNLAAASLARKKSELESELAYLQQVLIKNAKVARQKASIETFFSEEFISGIEDQKEQIKGLLRKRSKVAIEFIQNILQQTK